MRTALLLLALSLPLGAFDQESYGRALNGWHYDGSARYSLDGAQYRTKKPLVTTTARGNGGEGYGDPCCPRLGGHPF